MLTFYLSQCQPDIATSFIDIHFNAFLCHFLWALNKLAVVLENLLYASGGLVGAVVILWVVLLSNKAAKGGGVSSIDDILDISLPPPLPPSSSGKITTHVVLKQG